MSQNQVKTSDSHTQTVSDKFFNTSLLNDAHEVIIRDTWKYTIRRVNRRLSLSDEAKKKLHMSGEKPEEYLAHKSILNELSTLDNTMYDTARFEKYVAMPTIDGKRMTHDGTWHIALVLTNEKWLGACAYGSAPNKRDAEAKMLCALYSNILDLAACRPEADIEQESTSTTNSTSVTTAIVETTTDYEEEVIKEEVLSLCTEPALEPKEMMDRWIQLDVFNWDATGLGGAPIRRIRLPRALTATIPNLCDSLVMAIWRLNRLARMDMEIKFVCPSQPFISGLMFAKFLYEADADANIMHRMNKYSMSHGKHAQVRPGSKTNAVMRVKFANRNSLVACQKSGYDQIMAMNIGSLIMTEAVPLGAGAGQNVSVNVAVMIRFTAKQLVGRVHGGFLEVPKQLNVQEGLIGDAVDSAPGQMIASTVSEVEAMLNTVRKSTNEDKPFNPMIRTVVVPRFMESMSAGTNIDEQLLSMRLDAKGKKPSIVKSGDDDLSKICRDEGLFKQVRWTTSNPVGYTLLKIPIDAINEPADYDRVNVDGISACAMPPVDVVSSCFNYYAGSLEYRIQVVNTQFHNGALVACIIPLVDETDIVDDPNMNSLSDVKRHIVELGVGTNEIIVRSDYINTNSIIGTRSSDRFATTPRRSMGLLILKVQSVLRRNNAAAAEVYINIYKRGGPDFEVIELKNTNLVPSFDAIPSFDPTDILLEINGDNDYLAGSQNARQTSQLRQNSVAGPAEWQIQGRNASYAQIIGIEPTNFYPNFPEKTFAIAMDIRAIDSVVRKYYFNKVVLLRNVSTGNLNAYPLIESYSAVAGTQIFPITNLKPDYFSVMAEWVRFYQDTYPIQTFFDLLMTLMVIGLDETQLMLQYYNGSGRSNKLVLARLADDFLSLNEQQADVDSGMNIAVPFQPKKPSQSWGMKRFGEEGGSLQAIFRRPRYVTSFFFNPAKDLGWPHAHITTQITHWLPPIDYADPVHFSNRWSTQSLLSLAFLWVAGSISRRIVGPNVDNLLMWTNHKPYDKPNETFGVKYHRERRDAPVYEQAIGFEMNNLSINSHMNVNISWKNENRSNLLCNRAPVPSGNTVDKNLQQCYDIGTSDIGFQSTTTNLADENLIFTIFDSYGDDCEIHGYRGFPPMLFQSEVEFVPARIYCANPFKEDLTQEGDIESNPGPFFSKMNDRFMDMSSDIVAGAISKSVDVDAIMNKAVSQLSTDVNTTVEEKFAIMRTAADELMATMTAQTQDMGFKRMRSVLLGEAVHLIAHPDKTTLIASVVNILLQLGLFTYETVTFVQTELNKLFNSPDEPEEEDVNEPSTSGLSWIKTQEAHGTQEHLESFISLILTSICAYIGWTNPVIKQLDWKQKLAFAIPSFAGMGYSIKRFVTNFFPMLRWCFDYVVGLKARYIDDPCAGFVHINENILSEWVAHVQELYYGQHDVMTIEYRDSVYLAYEIAKQVEKFVIAKTSRFNIFIPIIEKARKMAFKLEADGIHPYVRKEPFSIWMYGDSGVGKSHLMNDIIAKLICANGVHVPEGEMTLPVVPTAKYLNRVKGQPEIRLDDFGAVIDEQSIAAQLDYVFSVMTCAPYVPNQAHVDKKDMLYAPAFLTVLCNSAYPENLPVGDPPSFLKRRNATIYVAGDDKYLHETFGEEFNEMKSKPGFIYGHLDERMKVGNRHLKFKFQIIDINHKAIDIKYQGRQWHTFAEMQEVLQGLYNTYDKRAVASYKSRITAHYAARNAPVPNFSELLSANHQDISAALAYSIASSAGDRAMKQKIADTIKGDKKALEIWDSFLEKNSVSNILNKHYASFKTQQNDGEDAAKASSSTSSPTGTIPKAVKIKTIKNEDSFMPDSYWFKMSHAQRRDYRKLNKVDRKKFVADLPSSETQNEMIEAELLNEKTFLNLYPEIVREAIRKEMQELTVIYSDQALIMEKGDLIPLSYKLLEKATCAHRTQGKSVKKIRDILILPECTIGCWKAEPILQECLSHHTLMNMDDGDYIEAMSWYESAKTTIVNWKDKAWEMIKTSAKWIYKKVKILGINAWKFFKDHWKAVTALAGVVFGIVLATMSRSKQEDIFLKVDPNGRFMTKNGLVLRSLGSISDTVRGKLGLSQEAYNPKVRTQVLNVRTPAERQPNCDNTQEGNIDNSFASVQAAFIPVHCKMNEAWGKPEFKTSMFAYGGRKVLMTRHEWEIISSCALSMELLLRMKDGSPYTIEIDPKDLKWTQLEHYKGGIVREGNFGWIDLPKNVPAAKSLIKRKGFSFFQNSNTINSFVGALMVPLRIADGVFHSDVFIVDYEHLNVPERTQSVTRDGRAITSMTVYSDNYKYNVSKTGYCMGALVDYGSGKVVGFHYCGDGRNGYAERILTEYLPLDKYEYEQPDYEVPNESFAQIDGVIREVGHSEIRFQQNGRSNITESVIHGAVEVRTARAILSPQDERMKEYDEPWSPLYLGVSKHGKPPLNFPSHHVEEAYEDFKTVLLRAKPVIVDTKRTIRELTVRESVFGIPGMINSIDTTTSAGYGWSKYGSGKHGLIDLDREWIHRDLLIAIRNMEEKFQSGVVPFIMAVDCLKDETLPLDKIKKPGHTRIISTLPVEYQILLRKYTMAFVVSHQAYNFETEHAIGISVCGPNEMQFDILGKIMEGGKIVAGDFKNFGPGANAIVAAKCCEAICNWYQFYGASQKYVETLRIIMEVLVCTPHLAYDKIYKTCSGIVSGSAVTVVLNSMIHSMYIRVACLGMGISIRDMHENVVICTYGDDGLMRVSDYLIDKLNVKTLREWFAQYNIIYTSVDKSDNIIPFTSLTETSFLKHSFKLNAGQYLAALEPRSIENQINWISRKGDKVVNTVENCRNALSQAYAHGCSYYDKLRDTMTEALIMKGKFAYFPTYAEMRLIRYETTSGEYDIASNLLHLKKALITDDDILDKFTY
uniref:Genome polyprotein n=1 Tax=Fish-associated iflavirus TaxID=3003966 RepID=A0A9E9FWM9_9VIRU|nr:MAG: polyprotein [Fish-associated iflavirus]